MSRRWIAAAALITTVSCAAPDSLTSPDATGADATASVVSCSAAQGQQLIDVGDYDKAIKEFTCLIELEPTEAEGYRGRIEAQLLLGRYSDAVRDYTRVTAFVEPVHPDVGQTIVAGYQARLAAAPAAVPALTGLSFAHWYFFNYPGAMHVADDLLLVEPDNLFGNLFRGSSRLLHGTRRAEGAADLDRAIELAPASPDVRFIIADAYTYGYLPDPQRAFAEASLALGGGLDTPRIRAILGAAYLAFGNADAAAEQIDLHLEAVTTELVGTAPLAAGKSLRLGLVPGRTYEIPLPASAGETVSVSTGSKDFWDTILVLLAPDGSLVLGSDDYKGYLAGFSWVAPAAGTYRVKVTSFESVSTGELLIVRK